MPASLLEILRSIPDHRRAEGKRFDLATVLLYAILAMVAGANSYRQMHEFIRVHLQRLNEAFGFDCLIRRPTRAAADPARRRPSGVGGRVSTPRVLDSDADPVGGADGDRRRRQDAARQFRRLQRPQGRAYDVGAAPCRQIVLAHVMVAEKSNEIPTAPELIEALGLKGCLFTLDAEHSQKNCSNA